MLKLVTPPVDEPVTLDEIKLHLRIDGTYEDAILMLYLTSVRSQAESILKRAILNQTWQYTCKLPTIQRGKISGDFEPRPKMAWTGDHASRIQLPMGRLQSVTTIERQNGDTGVWSEMDADEVVIDYSSEPGEIWPVDGWADDLETYQLRFTYVVGYGETALSVPPEIKLAILMAVAECYANRENGRFPASARSYLDALRIYSF